MVDEKPTTDMKPTMREKTTHVIALAITIPSMAAALYVILLGGERAAELAFISGLLGVIMGFYFGQRGVERVESGREDAMDKWRIADEARRNAEDEMKEADEAKRIAEEERKETDEECKRVEGEKKELETLRALGEFSFRATQDKLERYWAYLKEEEWRKFKSALPKKKQELLSPWDTAEDDRTDEQNQFLLSFYREWERKDQMLEDQTGEVDRVVFIPPQSRLTTGEGT